MSPLGAALSYLLKMRVDGTAVIRESSGLKANYSDDFMQYYNRAFALKSRQYQLGKRADLKGKGVVVFQAASKYLGEEFGRTVADNPSYKEMANQETQTLMLLLGRMAIVIMGESIFRFLREKLITKGKAPRAAEHEAFPPGKCCLIERWDFAEHQMAYIR